MRKAISAYIHLRQKGDGPEEIEGLAKPSLSIPMLTEPVVFQ
ncbi:MAG TPA: hypothetical protein VE971_01985 [Candidatus Eisenbacteria bacterium]|nr:hypothetical protein [Candidatus Eisenbacteria bacterium]